MHLGDFRCLAHVGDFGCVAHVGNCRCVAHICDFESVAHMVDGGRVSFVGDSGRAARFIECICDCVCGKVSSNDDDDDDRQLCVGDCMHNCGLSSDECRNLGVAPGGGRRYKPAQQDSGGDLGVTGVVMQLFVNTALLSEFVSSCICSQFGL